MEPGTQHRPLTSPRSLALADSGPESSRLPGPQSCPGVWALSGRAWSKGYRERRRGEVRGDNLQGSPKPGPDRTPHPRQVGWQHPGRGHGWDGRGNSGESGGAEGRARLSVAECSQRLLLTACLQTWAWSRRSGGFWDPRHADRRLLMISEPCWPAPCNICATVLLAVISINTFYLNKLSVLCTMSIKGGPFIPIPIHTERQSTVLLKGTDSGAGRLVWLPAPMATWCSNSVSSAVR